MKRLMGTMAAGIACLALLNGSDLNAQDQPRSSSSSSTSSGGDRNRGRGNFDPAEWRQRRLDDTKERLEVKDDAEWKVIQPLVEKVMEAQQAVLRDRMSGMFGRRPGGDRGGDSNSGGDRSRSRGFGGMGEPSPEAEALQKAIDSKASGSDMKAAIAKFQEARKKKMADMEAAQANLKAVLSVRQEAIATASGLL
jgi:hypothetical protein